MCTLYYLLSVWLRLAFACHVAVPRRTGPGGAFVWSTDPRQTVTPIKVDSPIRVNELKACERVILNCTESQFATRHEAKFEGIFRSLEEALANERNPVNTDSIEFLSSGKTCARFLFQRLGSYPCAPLDEDPLATFLVHAAAPTQPLQ